MQPSKSSRLLQFLRNLLVGEIALVAIVTLLWSLTGWHTTSEYDMALIAAGEVFLGLAVLMKLGGQGEEKMAHAEMEMRSWNRRNNSRFTSIYGEMDQIWMWLTSLGLLTIVIGLVVNRILH